MPLSNTHSFVERSRRSVWHPCTQMQHHESVPLVPLRSGQGAWLTDVDGHRYLDAVSSWWVNLLGHGHPRVVEAVQHPNADRLRVCKVDTGAGVVQVVCGAPNARTGMKAVFANAGDFIPGKNVVLKVGEIRGVKSEGMLLSAMEMGLGEDNDGIIDQAVRDRTVPAPGQTADQALAAQYPFFAQARAALASSPSRTSWGRRSPVPPTACSTPARGSRSASPRRRPSPPRSR